MQKNASLVARASRRLLSLFSPSSIDARINDAHVLNGSINPPSIAPAGLTENYLSHFENAQENPDGFSYLCDAMPQMVWTAKPDGNIDYYNAKWSEYTGMSSEESQNWGWKPVLHPDDLERCLKLWNHALITGDNYQSELRVKRASDGEYRWHLVRALPLRNDQGDITKWFGTTTDIHNQKLAEQALAFGEERYRCLLKMSSDIIWSSSAKGELVSEQSSWAEFTGQTAAQYHGNGWAEAVHPEDRDYTLELWRQALETRSTFALEHRIKRFDGEYRTFFVRAIPIFNQDGSVREWVGAHSDVTDQKIHAEMELAHVNGELQESELRYRSVAESANDAIISSDSSGLIISWNTSASKLFGYIEEEAIGLPLSIIMPERFRKMHESGMQRLRNGEPSRLLDKTIEIIGLRRTGEEFPIELSLSSWTSSLGQCFTGMIRDITQRKQVESQLAAEATRRSAIIQTQAEIAQAGLDLAKVLLLVTNSTRDLTRATASVVEMIEGEELVSRAASEGAASLVGTRVFITQSLSGACVRSRTAQQCEDSDSDTRVDRNVCRRFNIGSMLVVPLEHAGRVLGTLKVFSTNKSAFSEADTQVLVLMSNMVAASLSQIQSFEERQKLLEQLSQSNRELLSATHAKSRFLANMSHEIRTPLTSIIGFTESVLTEKLTETEKNDALSTVIRNSKHLVGVINDILDLSKIEAGKMDLEVRKTSLSHIVSDVSNLMQLKAQEQGIAFGFEFSYPIPKIIETDSTRLKQILFNLIGNAIKFTAKGGVKVLTSYSAESKQISFAVCDTGIGLREDQITSCFKHSHKPTFRRLASLEEPDWV